MHPSKLLKNKIAVSALLIDLDGVLIFGDKQEVTERLLATAQSLSLPINKEELHQICNKNSTIIDMISEIVKETDISPAQFEQEKEKFEGKFDHLLSLGDGVVDTLDHLKKLNLSLAIVSTRTSASIPRILAANGILEYFKVIVGRNECKNRKPSPEPLEYALKELGVSLREEVYMIGDKQNEDIQAAINAGIKSILVNKKIDPDDALPTFHITHFKDLKELAIF